ncbi:hypothetical protein JKI95_11185 [Corynebacterium aquatimens]|uniref:thermonuclease family protein n=1 Tax=Corynebacterium aquatimens TaxID=1190508 RepID=UPI002541C966|nr:hypothetical protein [Corynebacterium aquatimens]QYH19566.1 hypothetical protein JKI95_11185 [Corynebacterium aquatimens]
MASSKVPCTRSRTRNRRRDAFRLLLAIAIAAAAITAIAVAVRTWQGHDPDAVTVEKIVDGDTIDIRRDGETTRVRLLNIDTPEQGECLSTNPPIVSPSSSRPAAL